MTMRLLSDYCWHIYLCWQTRRRGELCEAVSFEEFMAYPLSSHQSQTEAG